MLLGTHQKCYQVHVRSYKSSAYLENLTRVCQNFQRVRATQQESLCLCACISQAHSVPTGRKLLSFQTIMKYAKKPMLHELHQKCYQVCGGSSKSSAFFGGSDTVAAAFLESPSNIVSKCFSACCINKNNLVLLTNVRKLKVKQGMCYCILKCGVLN